MTETTTATDLASIRADRLTGAGEFWAAKIAKSADNARLTYKAAGVAVGSVASRISAGKHQFLVDEPAGLAGDDAAASPVEYALGAIISCQVVVYRLYAQQLGLVIDELTIEAEGDLDVRGLFGIDESVRPGFTDVRLTVNIAGPGTQEEYEELGRLVETRCPVQDLFANLTPVSAVVAKV